MGRSVLLRAGQYLVVLLVAVVVNFVLPRLAPGNPVDYLLGSDSSSLTLAQRAALTTGYGLDGSLVEQFIRYLGRLGQGDLGLSIRQSRPVIQVIGERVPWTLALLVSALVLGTAIGVGTGVLAAARRGRRSDVVLTAGMLTVGSLPGFWTGLVLIGVFAAGLGWFPSYGAVPAAGLSPGIAGIGQIAHRLVLPVLTVTLASVGETFLLARGAIVSALDHPYVRLAEAKGVPPRRVLLRHALPNALLPIATRVTLLLGLLVSGAVVVEGVFSYPGLGQLIYQSVLARDYPVLQGAFLLVTLVVVATNLLADLAYPLLDPRVERATSRPLVPGE